MKDVDYGFEEVAELPQPYVKPATRPHRATGYALIPEDIPAIQADHKSLYTKAVEDFINSKLVTARLKVNGPKKGSVVSATKRTLRDNPVLAARVNVIVRNGDVYLTRK